MKRKVLTLLLAACLTLESPARVAYGITDRKYLSDGIPGDWSAFYDEWEDTMISSVLMIGLEWLGLGVEAWVPKLIEMGETAVRAGEGVTEVRTGMNAAAGSRARFVPRLVSSTTSMRTVGTSVLTDRAVAAEATNAFERISGFQIPVDDMRGVLRGMRQNSRKWMSFKSPDRREWVVLRQVNPLCPSQEQYTFFQGTRQFYESYPDAMFCPTYGESTVSGHLRFAEPPVRIPDDPKVTHWMKVPETAAEGLRNVNETLRDVMINIPGLENIPPGQLNALMQVLRDNEDVHSLMFNGRDGSHFIITRASTYGRLPGEKACRLEQFCVSVTDQAGRAGLRNSVYHIWYSPDEDRLPSTGKMVGFCRGADDRLPGSPLWKYEETQKLCDRARQNGIRINNSDAMEEWRRELERKFRANPDQTAVVPFTDDLGVPWEMYCTRMPEKYTDCFFHKVTRAGKKITTGAPNVNLSRILKKNAVEVQIAMDGERGTAIPVGFGPQGEAQDGRLVGEWFMAAGLDLEDPDEMIFIIRSMRDNNQSVVGVTDRKGTVWLIYRRSFQQKEWFSLLRRDEYITSSYANLQGETYPVHPADFRMSYCQATVDTNWDEIKAAGVHANPKSIAEALLWMMKKGINQATVKDPYLWSYGIRFYPFSTAMGQQVGREFEFFNLAGDRYFTNGWPEYPFRLRL